MEREIFLKGKPYSYPGFMEKIEIFNGKGISIIKAKDVVDFPEESTHAHSSYEFVFPYNTLESTWVGNKKMSLEKNRLIPINSEQEHGPARPYEGCNMLSVVIEKELLTELSAEIYGKRKVFFYNDNYKFTSVINNYIYNFIEEFWNEQSGSEFILQSLAVQVAVYMFRHLRSNLSPDTRLDHCGKENINRVIDYFMECYTKEYSLDEVAKLANLSPYYFIKVFKNQTGKTPYEFLQDVKIARACSLLKQSNYTITEICFLCGFSNSSHFTNVFRKKMGIPPSEFRKSFYGPK